MKIIQPLTALWLLNAVMAECSQGGSLSPVGKQPISGKEYAKSSVQEPGGWEWRVGAGPSYRSLGGVDFRTGRLSAASMVTPVRPLYSGYQQTSRVTSNAGPASSSADRRYRNGFVFIDDSTAAPGSFLPGTTAFWGYQEDAQVNAGILRYDAGVYGDSHVSDDSAGQQDKWKSDLAGSALAYHADAIYKLNNDLRVGGTLGYLFIAQDISHSGSTFSGALKLNERLVSVSDLYDLKGVVAPAAPYSGTFSHPGTAPLIDNIPSERHYNHVANTDQTVDFANHIEQSFDLSLHTISLGPVVQYAHFRFFASASLGFAVNLAAWDASFRESLVRTQSGRSSRERSWRRNNSGTDVLPGFFLQGNAGWQLSDQWSLTAFGRWDWCDDLDGRAGPAEFSAELGGATFGASITLTF
jgi:hypothetical protein